MPQKASRQMQRNTAKNGVGFRFREQHWGWPMLLEKVLTRYGHLKAPAGRFRLDKERQRDRGIHCPFVCPIPAFPPRFVGPLALRYGESQFLGVNAKRSTEIPELTVRREVDTNSSGTVRRRVTPRKPGDHSIERCFSRRLTFVVFASGDFGFGR